MKQVIKFGTDGIRGDVRFFPFTLEALFLIGYSLGVWHAKRAKDAGILPKKILVGCDTRESCGWIKEQLFAGLCQFPISIVDVGIAPTPAILQIVMQQSDYDIGIMISASHNPFNDNGIKIFTSTTGKLSLSDEVFIEDTFKKNHTNINFSFSGAPLGIVERWDGALSWYEEYILRRVSANFLVGITLVVDCAYGAMADIAPRVLRKLGAHVIALNIAYTGTNINEAAGALHPESLQAMVIASKAKLGIAFDGDGDRIVVVTAEGHVRDGDEIMAELLDLAEYSTLPLVVGTVLSNLGFEDYLRKSNKQLKRVSVGDKYVAASLDELGVLLGGEPSGHIILRDYLPSGDGLFVAIRLLQALQNSGNWLLNKFLKWPQVSINVPIVSKKNLEESPFLEIIKQHTLDLPDGRLVVRYSGTENVLRVMTEGADYKIVYSVAHSLAKNLQAALNNV